LKKSIVELNLEREKSPDLQSPRPSLVQKEGGRERTTPSREQAKRTGIGSILAKRREWYPRRCMKSGDGLERRSEFQGVLHVEMLFTSKSFFCSHGCT